MKYFRQFGGTTGAVLEALGQAMQWPGRQFSVSDFMSIDGENRRAYSAQRVIATKLITDLGLRKIELRLSGDGLSIVSFNYGSTEEAKTISELVIKDATKEEWEDHLEGQK